jgi:hypothetical protein
VRVYFDQSVVIKTSYDFFFFFFLYFNDLSLAMAETLEFPVVYE